MNIYNDYIYMLRIQYLELTELLLGAAKPFRCSIPRPTQANSCFTDSPFPLARASPTPSPHTTLATIVTIATVQLLTSAVIELYVIENMTLLNICTWIRILLKYRRFTN
jgi:hypothetical protein